MNRFTVSANSESPILSFFSQSQATDTSTEDWLDSWSGFGSSPLPESELQSLAASLGVSLDYCIDESVQDTEIDNLIALILPHDWQAASEMALLDELIQACE